MTQWLMEISPPKILHVISHRLLFWRVKFPQIRRFLWWMGLLLFGDTPRGKVWFPMTIEYNDFSVPRRSLLQDKWITPKGSGLTVVSLHSAVTRDNLSQSMRLRGQRIGSWRWWSLAHLCPVTEHFRDTSRHKGDFILEARCFPTSLLLTS